MHKRDFVAGASASMNKTITAIMKYLEDDGSRPPRKFRAFLHEKIADSNELWYRRGFNRGHRESFDSFDESGKVPSTLKYKCNRLLFTGQERTIALNSRIRTSR